MSRRVVFRRAAEHELNAAVDWYDNQRHGLGDEFLTEVTEALHRVAEHPQQYPVVLKAVRRAVLEQGRLTSGTTWHAAGLIGQMRPNRTMTRMSRYGIELYAAPRCWRWTRPARSTRSGRSGWARTPSSRWCARTRSCRCRS